MIISTACFSTLVPTYRYFHPSPTRRSSDLIVRIGRVVAPAQHARGWHVSSTLGSFGAATAVARLLRLDPEGIRTAVNLDRKSTRLNSSHITISYAVFCLNKKTTETTTYNVC